MDYSKVMSHFLTDVSPYAGTGNALSVAAGRVSLTRTVCKVLQSVQILPVHPLWWDPTWHVIACCCVSAQWRLRVV